MYPDFNRLRVFFYVYKKGSIIAASQVLHITQPAISQQISKLEEELQVNLFLRVNKRLIPTSEGEALFQTIYPFIRKLDQQINQFEQSKITPSGLLRIGMPYEFGEKYLPSICAAFYHKYPDVRYLLKFGDTVTLLDMLQRGVVDIAGIDTLSNAANMEWNKHKYILKPVFEEDVCLVCATNYFTDIMKEDDSIANILRQPFVTDEEDGESVKDWFRYHHQMKIELPVWKMMAKNHSVIVDCIRCGMGIGITSTHFVRDEILKNELYIFKTDNPPITNYVSLAYLADKSLSLTEQVFMDFIAKQML